MTDKPPTTDPEQRKANTEASRRQSGLPPEQDVDTEEPTRAEPATERSGRDARGD